MNIKFLSILSLLVLIFSCNKKQVEVETESLKDIDSLAIQKADISKMNYTDYILDSKTEEAIINWIDYNRLENIINDLKNADLNFFYNNHKEVKEVLNNLKQNIPLEVNNLSIVSRLTALETKILKFESLVNLSTTNKTELLDNIEELLIAFSNLKLQMNKKIELDNIVIERD